MIEKMITHMQYGNGASFQDGVLDRALKEQILKDYTDNSSRLRVENVLKANIDWEKKCYPAEKKYRIRNAISKGKLPKFNRLQDNFNGMGITVHDTWATHITLKSLQIANDRYQAVVHYKVQDHFGLDVEDISKFRFNHFLFFVFGLYCSGLINLDSSRL